MSAHISLAEGNGGVRMRELIVELIANTLGDVLMDISHDATLLPRDNPDADILFTTDGFTVKPLEFPGGNIGSLAIHGTVNDLAVCGATPAYLSLNLLLEEGLETDCLRRILTSMRVAAKEAGVRIACGDTKVVPRGEGSGVYITTSGIGFKSRSIILGFDDIQEGDAILVSGPVGDHGIAVMLAREQFGLRGDVQSDAASVLPLTQAIQEIEGVRFMRDPTRGGLATVLHEITRASDMGIILEAEKIPIRDPVATVCEMLGYDPLYLACEGRVVAVVNPNDANKVLDTWKSLPQGQQASRIGTLTSTNRRVIIQTALGGQRILEELEDDPLPRIC